ncbi:MAG: ABC transporter permease [Spirochaetae bacterium HGW-Spirochaetae-1]|jgi:ABC-type multidrug transport system permease subunit|nr:MAG: ABC transporter permease [Spirochaetae bacterium HGW-Spirochaetae-1]
MIRRLCALISSRTKEFYRDRSALGWNLLFPFMIIFGFSLIFNQDKQVLYKVGVLKETSANSLPVEPEFAGRYEHFRKTRFIEFIDFNSLERGMNRLEHHRIDFLVSPERGEYWVSKTSPKGYIVEKLFQSSAEIGPGHYTRQDITGREIPYVEWLFPGILGMNIMFSSLFGVGYVVVRYRKNGVLKRFSVTPVRTFEFLTAQIVSRMAVILLTTFIVYAGCALIYGFQCRGSYLNLFLSFALGGFSMVSLGLLVAARSSSEEFAGGILNIITWPMMFLSEVWFSLEGAHPWVSGFSKVLPLTHMIDSSRMIMNDGAGLMEVREHFITLAVMSIIFITLGSLMFKWQKDS